MPDSLCSLLQTLDSILNVEMVKDKSAEEIKQVMNLNRLNFVLHLCLIVIYVGEWEFYLKIRLKSKTWLYVHKKKKGTFTCISIVEGIFLCIGKST